MERVVSVIDTGGEVGPTSSEVVDLETAVVQLRQRLQADGTPTQYDRGYEDAVDVQARARRFLQNLHRIPGVRARRRAQLKELCAMVPPLLAMTTNETGVAGLLSVTERLLRDVADASGPVGPTFA